MNRTITAYFDSRSEAETAVDRLTSAGIPRSSMDVHDSSTAGTSTAAADEDKGFWASLTDLFMPDEDRYSYSEGIRRGGSVLTVRSDGQDFDRVCDILEEAGAVDLDERESEWRAQGWSGYDPSTMGTATGAGAGYSGSRSDTTPGQQYADTRSDISGQQYSGAGASSEEYVPVAEEQLRVGKREVDHGRVRVRSYVKEDPVEEQVHLRNENVDVERNPIDRAPTSSDRLFEERTIEAEERGEEAVVSKEPHVTEEVRLRKDVDERDETIRDTVRHTEVEIEDERSDTGLTDEERARRDRG